MSSLIDLLNAWSDRWATLVVAAVWQSSVLVVLVAAVSFALRRSSPAVRYWLWQIVAVKLLVLPLWSWSLAVPWSVHWPVAPEHRPAPVIEATDPFAEVAEPAVPRAAEPRVPGVSPAAAPNWYFKAPGWQSWLLVGWASVVSLQVLGLALQKRRLARLLGQTTPGEAELSAVVVDVARSLQLRRPPAVRVTAADCSPFVCGIVRPVLVLPQSLLTTLEPAEFRQVLAHELAHVKRHDLAWGWIPEMARVLYFFHPVAHWAHYRIRLERELACDQLALQHFGRGPAQYADTLVRVIGMASRPSVLRTSAAAGLDGQARLTESTALRQ